METRFFFLSQDFHATVVACHDPPQCVNLDLGVESHVEPTEPQLVAPRVPEKGNRVKVVSSSFS